MTPRLWRYRHAVDVVTNLVAREFRLRYRRSVLGWLWALARPLTRLLVLSFLFTRIVRLGIPNYPLFLFSGLIAWSWFAAGVGSATSSAVDRRELLLRPGLPRAVVPFVSVLIGGLDYVAALPVLAVFLLVAEGVPLTALALPVVMGVQLLLMLGLGFALCAANVYVRDAHLFVEAALMLGFYVTPVFYDPAFVPARYRWVIDLNPMAHLLTAHRQILVEGRLPAAGPFLLLTAACGAVAVAGYLIYRRSSPTFVDEL